MVDNQVNIIVDTITSQYERYLIEVALTMFGDNLIGISSTDSYLRQPDYSSRVDKHFYFIIDNVDEWSALLKIRYVRHEFPDATFNMLFLCELKEYPGHGSWQFKNSRWIYLAKCFITITSENFLEQTRQCVFSTYHLSRLYYMRELSAKTHVWGVRQYAWALRYLYNCIYTHPNTLSNKLSNCISQSLFEETLFHWKSHENNILESKNNFRYALNALSDTATKIAKELQFTHPENAFTATTNLSHASNTLGAILDKVRYQLDSVLGNNLRCFYLHGSAARGDARAGSDIDTFIVINYVDREILAAVKMIQDLFKVLPLTISVYSLNEINQYPRFRRYALMNGIKHVSGDYTINYLTTLEDDLAGILNNIFTIRQVARSYIIEGSYGDRAHYAAGLMAKLLDHGCLRSLQKISTGHYPTSRNIVRQFFNHVDSIQKILDFVDTMHATRSHIETSLLEGNNTPIENIFSQLLTATRILKNKYDNHIENEDKTF